MLLDEQLVVSAGAVDPDDRACPKSVACEVHCRESDGRRRPRGAQAGRKTVLVPTALRITPREAERDRVEGGPHPGRGLSVPDVHTAVKHMRWVVIRVDQKANQARHERKNDRTTREKQCIPSRRRLRCGRAGGFQKERHVLEDGTEHSR